MKPSILIIDDEEMSRFILREALTKRGYSVEEAPDAEAGLKKIRRGQYDLIMLDVQMPGLSGIDAIPKIKDVDPTVIIIMTTALGSKEMIMEAISRGNLVISGNFQVYLNPADAHGSMAVQKVNPTKLYPTVDATTRAFATSPHSADTNNYNGAGELTPTEFYALILAADMGANFYARENNPHTSGY